LGKPIFWEQAERTRNAAIERKKRAEELVREREDREAAEKMKAARLKRYEAAPVLQLEITQVLNDGCLAMILNDNHKGFLSNCGALIWRKVRGMKFERSNGGSLNTRPSWAHPLLSNGGLLSKSRIEARGNLVPARSREAQNKYKLHLADFENVILRLNAYKNRPNRCDGANRLRR
jgi:hypothetical protein